MLGPGLNVRGGITSVQKVILAGLPDHVQSRHLETMVEGGKVLKLLTFLKCMLRLEIILRQGVDVVHIHFSSGASSIRKEILARRAMLAGRSVVMHAHGSEYRLYWHGMTEAQKRRTLRVLKKVSVLVVLGDAWREFFSSIGVPGERIVVLPNPVKIPETIPSRAGRKRLTFAFLGMIGDRKGSFDLLKAICQLTPNTRNRCHFIFAGNGEVGRLRKLADASSLTSEVSILEWIDADKRDELLAEADAFVLPSYNEGLPMALLEAMAWGLPTICTPVGSIPDVVIDGQNGLLVPPGDVAAITAAIERLAGNELERVMIGTAARSAVMPLSAERYIGRLCALYNDLN